MTLLVLAALLQVPPRVTDMSPTPGSIQTSPSSVILVLNAAVDPATVNASTVTLVGRGPDNAFGTGDDVVITPAALAVVGSTITLDLSAQILPDDVYRVRISGTPVAPATHAGLFGYWKLSEGSGIQALDTSGNGRHGTLSGGAAWESGLFGSALRLNGNVTRVDIDAGLVTPGWTVAVWADRTGDVSGIAATILDSISSTGTSVRMEQFTTNQLGMTEYTVVDEDYGVIPALDTWVHLAFSSDGSNARLHVNGALVHTSPRAYNLYVDKIGSAAAIRTHSMIGLLNELQIYGRVLTGPEITSLATLSGCVRSTGGEVLNGEYAGFFPSGDGSAGGNFVATFTVSSAPPPAAAPRVVNMIPVPGISLGSAPAAITVALDHPIDAATVTNSTVRLTRAGPDGLLGTGDDVIVLPASVSVVSGNQIRLDLTAVPMANDQYRMRLSGSPQVPPGTIGMWGLDEAAGPVAADGSGSGNNGTHVNNPTIIPGRTGPRALRLNGTNQNVDIPDVDALSPHLGASGAVSVSCWVRIFSLPAPGTTFPFVCKGSVGQFEYALHVHNDATVSYSISSLAGPLYGEARAGNLGFGAWHHLAGTMRKGQFVRVYLDGVELQNQTVLSGTTGNGTSPLQIGRIGPTQSWFLNGDIDDVRIYNIALTAAQVEILATLGLAVRDTTQNVLDGEFNGAFPSGDGTTNGDFVASFSLNVPGPFTMTAPANGSTVPSTSPTFTWSGSSGAASYTLQVATDPAFASLVLNQSGIVLTSQTPGVTLAPSTIHYWRVLAVNGSGTVTATGAPFSFLALALAGAGAGQVPLVAGGCGLSGLEVLLVLGLWIGARRLRSA